MLGNGIDIHREHIAVLGGQDALRLAGSQRAKNGKDVFLVRLRDTRVSGDGSNLGGRRDPGTDRTAIGIRVDFHSSLGFRDAVKRVLDSTDKTVSLLSGLKRRQDASTLVVKHPVHTVALDELKTLVERDKRVVQVKRAGAERTFTASQRHNLVVELVKDRRADDLVIAVEEITTQRAVTRFGETHTSLLKLVDDMLAVFAGKQSIGRVKQVLETLDCIVAKSTVTK